MAQGLATTLAPLECQAPYGDINTTSCLGCQEQPLHFVPVAPVFPVIPEAPAQSARHQPKKCLGVLLPGWGSCRQTCAISCLDRLRGRHAPLLRNSKRSNCRASSSDGPYMRDDSQTQGRPDLPSFPWLLLFPRPPKKVLHHQNHDLCLHGSQRRLTLIGLIRSRGGKGALHSWRVIARARRSLIGVEVSRGWKLSHCPSGRPRRTTLPLVRALPAPT